MKEFDMSVLNRGKFLKRLRSAEAAEITELLFRGGWCPEVYNDSPPDYVCAARTFCLDEERDIDAYCRECIYRYITEAGDSHD